MKVLIVDDEAYAVNALTNRIDWNGFGFGTPLSAPIHGTGPERFS